MKVVELNGCINLSSFPRELSPRKDRVSRAGYNVNVKRMLMPSYLEKNMKIDVVTLYAE